MWSAGEGDDKDRFLADLRALRDASALGFDELAARAHYPNDVLKEAERGPSLPGLPILAAYVRACDGDVLEWEERWRRLGFGPRADPGLPVRPAGASLAAAAGARASVGVAPPDTYDPERIRAALRGFQYSDRGVPRSAAGGAVTTVPGLIERDTPGPATTQPRTPESGANWEAGTRDAGWSQETAAGWVGAADGATATQPTWDAGFQQDAGFERDGARRWEETTADRPGTPANGSHQVSQPSDAAATDMPDEATAEAIRRDPFSADWLRDTELVSPHDDESAWRYRGEAGSPSTAADDWFKPREAGDQGTAGPPADDAAAESWFTPRERADTSLAPSPPTGPDAAPQDGGGLAAAGGTGYWTSPAAGSGPAEAQRPDLPPAEEHAVARTSWPTGGDNAASHAPGAADWTMPVPRLGVPASPAAPPGPASPAAPPRPARPRSDRLFPVRLLVVILVAALIGSVLVLLLR
jgi:hypothetical protein